MIKKKKKILVTDHLFRKENFFKFLTLKKKYEIVFNNTNKPHNDDSLKKLLNKNKDVIGIIAGLEKYNKLTLKNIKYLKAISRVGVGVDSLDLKYLEKFKIKVLKLNHELTDSVAELYLTLILNSLRKVIPNYESLRKGYWNPILGNNLSSKKIGIIGFGKVGKKIYKFLSPFKCDFYVFEKKKINKLNVHKSSVLDIFKKCDIVCISLNLNKNTTKIINKNVLDNSKQNLVLINASRGGIIDEKSLYIHFKKNKNSTAFLDCFTIEPYKGDLLKLDNIFSIPHIASYTAETRKKMEFSASRNLIKYLQKFEK